MIALGYVAYEAAESPANQLFGATVVSGATTRREVALTFDDGPSPPDTDRILDVLRAEHVRATFFVVGRAAAAYPATLRRLAREGHVIGNHTWDHRHLIVESTRAIVDELQRTDAVVARITGHHTDLMRPPFGARDFAVIEVAHRLGYRVVMWSMPLPRDWEQPGARAIARRVIDRASDGSIIVLHDGDRGRICAPPRRGVHRDCDRRQEAAATREIIEVLRARGFRFVTVPELLADANAATGRTVPTRIVSRRAR